jgi:multiple sugar transport system substrate-binding protein
MVKRAPDFKKLTGANINVIGVPFSDIYPKMESDFATGTNSVDAAVFAPQWMVDFIEPGYFEDLTPRVKSDSALEWDDVGLFFRSFSSTYAGKIYTIPLDGDFHMVYYRSDLLAAAGISPPKTWEEYIYIASRFHGQDMNGDGTPDYGSCISKKRNAQAYWMILSIVGSHIQTKGTGEGIFFDPKTMKPLVNNAAYSRAFDIYKETTKYAPPNEINLDVGDTRGLWTSGRCALTMDWGDIGTLAIEKGSKVKGKTGASILPGSRLVLDRNSGELVSCTKARCPYAVNGINHAPFAAFGGWSGAVNVSADSKVKDAAYDFFSYMAQPNQSNKDVTVGITGMNPYRISQFANINNWTSAGFSKAAAENYLGAIKSSLDSPNMILDLRIPKNQRYQQVVLDTEVHRFISGEITKEEAMQRIEDGWEEITEEVGRDTQLKAYRSTLGY